MALPRRTLLAAAAVACLPTAKARAQTPAPLPPEVAAALPGARLQGGGRLRVLGMHIYDARLWLAATASAENWETLPLALEVAYARKLVGEQIAERSLKEMRRQGAMAPELAARWLDTMKSLIPDVQAGDRLTALHQPGRGLRLFGNGAPIGDVPDADFARRFLGIWLSPSSSEPSLRRALLGRDGA